MMDYLSIMSIVQAVFVCVASLIGLLFVAVMCTEGRFVEWMNDNFN